MTVEAQKVKDAQRKAFLKMTESPRPGYGLSRATRSLLDIMQLSGSMGFSAMEQPFIQGGLSITQARVSELAKTGLITMDEAGFIHGDSDENDHRIDYGIVYHFDSQGRLVGEDYYQSKSDEPLTASSKRYAYDPEGRLQSRQWGLWSKHSADSFQYREERFIEEEPGDLPIADELLGMLESSKEKEEREKILTQIKKTVTALNDKQFAEFKLEVDEEAESLNGDIATAQEEINDMSGRILKPGADDDVEQLTTDLEREQQNLNELVERRKKLNPFFTFVNHDAKKREKAKEPAEMEATAVMRIEMRAQLHEYV